MNSITNQLGREVPWGKQQELVGCFARKIPESQLKRENESIKAV